MLKLGFIGGSINSIAGYPHFIASQMDRKFKVVAGAFSTDKDINKETANAWHVEHVYNDWLDLIRCEKNKIDAVVVLVPTPLHSEVILELLKNNIPIICEKTMVCSKDEVQEVSKAYNPKEHFLTVTNNYSGYPMVRVLKQEIKKGTLGKILHIRLQMPQESFLRPPKSVKYPQKWRLKDGFIPTISLDLGVHLHHLAFFLLDDEPSEVMAEFNSFSKYTVIDDINILLKYKSGIGGTFWLSKSALGYRNGMTIEIFGDKASAKWIQETPEKLEISFMNGQKSVIDRGSNIEIDNPLYNRMTPGHPAGFIEAFANLYNDIADDLDSFLSGTPVNNPFVFGFDHASNGINFFYCVSQSNLEKQWVKI